MTLYLDAKSITQKIMYRGQALNFEKVRVMYLLFTLVRDVRVSYLTLFFSRVWKNVKRNRIKNKRNLSHVSARGSVKKKSSRRSVIGNTWNEQCHHVFHFEQVPVHIDHDSLKEILEYRSRGKWLHRDAYKK